MAYTATTKDKLETVTNPVLIAEVLSNSTREYDRGDKFALYRGIASLQDYLLIEPDRVDVEHHVKTEAGWRARSHVSRGDVLTLAALPVTLRLDDLYGRVVAAPISG